MRRISIRTRIILWYILFFTLLMLINIFIVKLYADQLIDTQAESQIKTITENALEHLEVTSQGPLYIEYDDEMEPEDADPFRYLVDGVSFVIYEGQTLKYGQIPSTINQVPDVLLYNIQQVASSQDQLWLMYDVPIDQQYTLRGFYSSSDATAISQNIIQMMLYISPIILIVSGIGGFLIIKFAFKPIRQIYQTARDIKETKAFNLRVEEPKSKDEVAQLSLMINQMLDQMEQAIVREQEFSSNVSHELRTPLTVLRAQVEYLEDKNQDLTLEKDIKDILKQMKFIEQLISQLFELSRSKHIQETNFEMIDAYDVTHQVYLSLQEMMETKQITSSLQQRTDPLVIPTNQTLFIRILHNIITNAIKYNKEKGTIQINFTEDHDTISIHVIDSGIGMNEKTLKRIFDPFYREDQSRKSDDLSLGVGLTITKELVELLKGTIQIESSEFLGTKVTLTFKKRI